VGAQWSCELFAVTDCKGEGNDLLWGVGMRCIHCCKRRYEVSRSFIIGGKGTEKLTPGVRSQNAISRRID
jgi:hypothetical protein